MYFEYFNANCLIFIDSRKYLPSYTLFEKVSRIKLTLFPVGYFVIATILMWVDAPSTFHGNLRFFLNTTVHFFITIRCIF